MRQFIVVLDTQTNLLSNIEWHQRLTKVVCEVKLMKPSNVNDADQLQYNFMGAHCKSKCTNPKL